MDPDRDGQVCERKGDVMMDTLIAVGAFLIGGIVGWKLSAADRATIRTKYELAIKGDWYKCDMCENWLILHADDSEKKKKKRKTDDCLCHTCDRNVSFPAGCSCQNGNMFCSRMLCSQCRLIMARCFDYKKSKEDNT